MNPKKKFIYYSSPEHWFQTSLELHSSIETLISSKDSSSFIQNTDPENENSTSRPAPSKATYLLMAYSLENLLKGIHVLRDASLVNSGKIESKIATHNLNDLMEPLSIDLTKQQIDFQDLLSKQCVSNARYPVGRNENLKNDNPSITDLDFDIYTSLYEKYKWILVDELHEYGWNSGLSDESLNTEPKEFNYFEL